MAVRMAWALASATLAVGCATSKCPSADAPVGASGAMAGGDAVELALQADGRVRGPSGATVDPSSAGTLATPGARVALASEAGADPMNLRIATDALLAAGVGQLVIERQDEVAPAPPMAPPEQAPPAPVASSEPAAPPAPSTAPAAPAAAAAAPAEPAGSLPEVVVENVGLHIGGGPNDDAAKAPFKSAIETRFDDFRKCYVHVVEPKKGGTFGVDLFIGREGGKPEVRQPRTGMKGEDFRKCVIDAFSNVQFAKPERGPTVISYSLRFRLD